MCTFNFLENRTKNTDLGLINGNNKERPQLGLAYCGETIVYCHPIGKLGN